MKRKKLWIILASVVVGVFALGLGVHFLTKLSAVSVEFRTRLKESETRLEAGVLDKVKEDGDFNYKKSVLFINPKTNVDKIEKANPYVKVTQVIRKFPNKINVYVSERVPRYRMKDSVYSGVWYILDEEFKVLEVVTDENLESKNFTETTIVLNYISGNSLKAGEFFEDSSELEKLNEIMAGVYGASKDYLAVRSIDYDRENYTFTLKMRRSDLLEDYSGCEMQIVGINNLKEKVYKATHVYKYKATSEFIENDAFAEINIDNSVIISDNNGCRVIRQEG